MEPLLRAPYDQAELRHCKWCLHHRSQHYLDADGIPVAYQPAGPDDPFPW
jgi:hypothetical protein